MNNRKPKSNVSLFFLITLVIAGTLFVVVRTNSNKNVPVLSAPIPVAQAEVDTISIMDSPEGSKTLTLSTNILSTSLKDGSEEKQLYKKDLAATENLEIPFNTWSPDTKYLFIKDINEDKTDYLVFKSSGDTFAEGAVFLSIQDLFRQKVNGYIIEDVTGWADPVLLLVNVKKINEDVKASFWFDVTSQSFIQLSTYFR